jgi:hypothetical protein
MAIYHCQVALAFLKRERIRRASGRGEHAAEIELLDLALPLVVTVGR